MSVADDAEQLLLAAVARPYKHALRGYRHRVAERRARWSQWNAERAEKAADASAFILQPSTFAAYARTRRWQADDGSPASIRHGRFRHDSHGQRYLAESLHDYRRLSMRDLSADAFVGFQGRGAGRAPDGQLKH